MDAYLSNSQNRVNLFDPPPILIAADGEAAIARARRTVETAGLRVADAVAIGDAIPRIERQAAASALWIELSGELAGAADQLLDHVAQDVSSGRYPAIISARAGQVDALGGYVLSSDIEVLIDADEPERAAALALAVSGARDARFLSDVSADKQAARLRQLS